jgi:hypothetical protein
MSMHRYATGLAIVAAIAASPEALRAEPFTSEGITFSDELGGFVIRSLSGTGRLDDPFVLVEEVTGDGETVLVVRGLENAFGNRVETQHATGFALHKVVINATGQNWITYEIELRETRSASSPYEDGLSFGQAADRPQESSNRFAAVASVDEPYDGLSFRDGLAGPGSASTFTMIVTDETPQSAFLIVQHALLVVADARPMGEGLEAAAPGDYSRVMYDFVDGGTTP